MREETLPRIRTVRDRLLRAGRAGDAAVEAALATADPGQTLFCAHSGSSMNPTLCELDLLEVLSYAERTPRVGDVALFVAPDEEQLVVHRIVRLTHEGPRTRGDNNTIDDPYTLTPPDLIGQVVAAWRGRHRRPIRGGRAGLAHARWVHRRRAAERVLGRLLRPLYRRLAASGLLPLLVPRRLQPRVVRFLVDGEQRLRLLAGCRVVGHYDARREAWRIRRPYRLLVDESALPCRPSSLEPAGAASTCGWVPGTH